MKEKKEYIGQALKKARTDKNITLEKASKDTRITQLYLKSIEDEQLQKIPGDVVLKGFIRIYADYLGIDSKPLIAELNKRSKQEAPGPVEEK